MRHSCKQIEATDLAEWSGWRLVRSFFVFHFLRWYPSWAGWLPRHAPRLQPPKRPRRGRPAPRRRTRHERRGPAAARRTDAERRLVALGQARSRRWRFFALVAWLLVTRRAPSTGARCWSAVARACRCRTAARRRGAGRLQLRALQLLRPARPPLHGPHLRHRHGDGRHLHQLRLQPQPGLAGRRRRLPLPALLAAGPGQRRHHPRPRLQHADQLARLPGGRRRGFCSGR